MIVFWFVEGDKRIRRLLNTANPMIIKRQGVSGSPVPLRGGVPCAPGRMNIRSHLAADLGGIGFDDLATDPPVLPDCESYETSFPQPAETFATR